MENNTCEVESNVIHAEPHDVRMARRIIAFPKRDPLAEDSLERTLAGAVVRYWEKLQGPKGQAERSEAALPNTGDKDE